jgi:beta-aspartyl-peptidase (threonine type)
MPIFAIAVHGGAGTIYRAALSPEREQAYRSALEKAVRAGHGILANQGSSLDAVTAAVITLEDDPLFNAGHGAVFVQRARTNSMRQSWMARPSRRALSRP